MREQPKTKIVYIDDNPQDLRQARDALVTAGYEVCTHVSDATSDADVADADIVLIDFHMPGLDGGEVLARLRTVLSPGHRPFFYLYTSDRSLSGAYRGLGFDGQVILKGNVDALLRQLDAARRAVSLRRMRPAV
ncbi:MAG: response regulator [Deltaproteobacteria bacterium]|nr:response regulator [Nannocystaceae bacterium]